MPHVPCFVSKDRIVFKIYYFLLFVNCTLISNNHKWFIKKILEHNQHNGKC